MVHHTLNAGLSASLRACATRSWMSVFVMLAKSVNVSAGDPGEGHSWGSCHSLEGLCKGKYGERRHEPVDVGPVRRADGMISGIWRGVRLLDSGHGHICIRGLHTCGPSAQGQSQQSRLDFNESRLRHPVLQPQRRPGILCGLYACHIAL